MGANVIVEMPKPGSNASHSRVILDSVRMIVRALRVSSRLCESASELSGAQIFILRQLQTGGKLSINELAERTFTHQSTVSGVVSRLVDAGYVSRSPSKDDGRRLDLSLTSQGARTLESVPKTAQEVLTKAIRGLSPAKRGALAALMRELVETAGFAQDHPPLFFED
jgi:DNA-binding MarR family transcriptional regulator